MQTPLEEFQFITSRSNATAADVDGPTDADRLAAFRRLNAEHGCAQLFGAVEVAAGGGGVADTSDAPVDDMSVDDEAAGEGADAVDMEVEKEAEEEEEAAEKEAEAEEEAEAKEAEEEDEAEAEEEEEADEAKEVEVVEVDESGESTDVAAMNGTAARSNEAEVGADETDSAEEAEAAALRKELQLGGDDDDDIDDDDDAADESSDGPIVHTEARVVGNVSSDEEDGSSLDDEAAVRADAGSEIVSDSEASEESYESRWRARRDAETTTTSSDGADDPEAKRRAAYNAARVDFGWRAICGRKFTKRLLRSLADATFEETRMHDYFLNNLMFNLVFEFDPAAEPVLMAAAAAAEPSDERAAPLAEDGEAHTFAALLSGRQTRVSGQTAILTLRESMRRSGVCVVPAVPQSPPSARLPPSSVCTLSLPLAHRTDYLLDTKLVEATPAFVAADYTCALSHTRIAVGDPLYRVVTVTSPLSTRDTAKCVAYAGFCHSLLDDTHVRLFADASAGLSLACGRAPVARVCYVHASLLPAKSGPHTYTYNVHCWSPPALPEPRRKRKRLRQRCVVSSSSGSGAGSVRSLSPSAKRANHGTIGGRVLVVTAAATSGSADAEVEAARRRTTFAFRAAHAKYSVGAALQRHSLVFVPNGHWVFLANVRADCICRPELSAFDGGGGGTAGTQHVPQTRADWAALFVKLCADGDAAMEETAAAALARQIVSEHKGAVRAFIADGTAGAFVEVLFLLLRWFRVPTCELPFVPGSTDAVLSHTRTSRDEQIRGAFGAALDAAALLDTRHADESAVQRLQGGIASDAELGARTYGVVLRDNELPLGMGTRATQKCIASFISALLGSLYVQLCAHADTADGASAALAEATSRVADTALWPALFDGASVDEALAAAGSDERRAHFRAYTSMAVRIFHALFPPVSAYV